MAEIWQPHVVNLASELVSLVGRGITQAKTQNRLPNLKRVLGVPGDERVEVVRDRLKQRLGEQIHKFTGEFTILEPPVVVRAADLILALECLCHLITPAEFKDGRYLGLEEHEKRRLYAMDKLGVSYSVRTWRHNITGPELDLMLFFAKRLAELADTDEGFITELAEMSVEVDEVGVTRHVTVVGRLRATRDGVDHGDFYLYYKPDPRPDVYEIEFIEGITHSEEHWNDTSNTKLVTAYFDRLNIGDPLDYTYRLTLNTNKGVRSTVFHAPTTDYEHCRAEVSFSEDRLPEEVWWFERLAQFELPGRPTHSNLLLPGQGHTYVMEWDNVPGGYCCGIGWRWQGE